MELTFGEQIKIILKRKNMTIRQLAELVEVQTGKPMSRQNLTQKLNRDNFQEQDMKEVAQALGCVVQISVVDPGEAAGPSVQNAAALQAADQVPERRPAKGRAAGTAARLAKKEAAITRQPIPEEPEAKEVEPNKPEEDMLAWARKKPLVWPTLTVPTMAVREPEAGDLPFAEELFPEPEDLEDVAFWEEASVTEDLTKSESPQEPEAFGEPEKPEEGEIFKEPGKPEAFEELGKPEEEEAFEELEKPEEREAFEESKKPEEEEDFEEREKPEEGREFGEPEERGSQEIPEEAEDLEDLEDFGDLEFFDLEDFYGKEASPMPEADISSASAPYVISREDAEKKPEVSEEVGEDSPLEFFEPESFSGSRGDISSVSAPYVIPREPEDIPPVKPMGENGYWQDMEEPEQADEAEVFGGEQQEEPEEEEEPLSPDMEKKIASWDAAVKLRLENPFLRSLEGRARRGAEQERENRAVRDMQGGPKLRILPEARTETGGQINREERPEEESLDLQGPAIDPATGKEYETNTVKHHPTQPDMLLVYDQDEHRWIVQAERAFLNFQINKRALLGKDYEPPVYLD